MLLTNLHRKIVMTLYHRGTESVRKPKGGFGSRRQGMLYLPLFQMVGGSERAYDKAFRELQEEGWIVPKKFSWAGGGQNLAGHDLSKKALAFAKSVDFYDRFNEAQRAALKSAIAQLELELDSGHGGTWGWALRQTHGWSNEQMVTHLVREVEARKWDLRDYINFDPRTGKAWPKKRKAA